MLLLNKNEKRELNLKNNINKNNNANESNIEMSNVNRHLKERTYNINNESNESSELERIEKPQLSQTPYYYNRINNESSNHNLFAMNQNIISQILSKDTYLDNYITMYRELKLKARLSIEKQKALIGEYSTVLYKHRWAN